MMKSFALPAEHQKAVELQQGADVANLVAGTDGLSNREQVFISGPSIPTMETAHEDERREIREATLTGHDGALSRVTMLHIKEPAVLGNHYHRTPEHFTILSGNPTVLTAPKDDPTNVTVRTFPEGGHVTMQPGEAHTFHFDGPGTMISTMDGAFDPSNMYPQKLQMPVEQVAPGLISPEQAAINKRVTIATSTFYKGWYPGPPADGEPITSDKLRGDLALETIVAAGLRGYNTVVVDDGSAPAFGDAVKFLTGLYPGLVFEEQADEPGIDSKDPRMSAGRRQALQTASRIPGTDVVVWTEPEKVSMVRDCMDEPVRQILEDEADVVVPSRDEASFATYPKYQAEFEQESDKAFNGLLRTHGLRSQDDADIDAWIGPRFIRNTPELMEVFQRRYEFNEGVAGLKTRSTELWTNVLFIPLVAAIAQGRRVNSVPVSYRHPEEQTRFEAGLESGDFATKREFQKRSILTAVAHYVRAVVEQREGAGARIREF